MTGNPSSEQLTLLNRRDWLRARGFPKDPFPESALRAETDPLFDDKVGMPAFVEPSNFDQIKGSPDDPDCRFIFSISGGGKSSLRRRIKAVFDESLGINLLDDPKVITVEYIHHDEYTIETANTRSHVERILKLIEDRLRFLPYNIKIEISSEMSPRIMLENLIHTCRKEGVEGVCVLIDNIDSYDSVSEIAIDHIIVPLAKSDLLNIRGMIFKFMLPIELYHSAQKKLPIVKYLPHFIEWNRDLLREVLHQRLTTCMDDKIRDAKITPLAVLCDKQISDEIEDKFVDIGLELNQPRAMWRLGYFLLKEHFSRRRLDTDLIKKETFLKVYARVMGQEQTKRTRSELDTREFDVFLSHSSVDKPWVIKLKDALVRYGLSVWLDKDEIRPGDLFGEALEQALDNCRAVALIISPEAINSGWFKEEYYRALSLATDRQTHLIPVILRDVELPGFLLSRNWVDFRNETAYAENIRKLIWGITGQKPVDSTS